MSELGQKIKQARADRGLTQAQLADEMHVTRQTISNWENGRSVPDYVMLGQLAKVLQFDVGMPVAEETSAKEMPEQAEQNHPEPAQPKKKASRKRRLMAAAVILAAGVMMVIQWIVPSEKSPYTIEWFSQEQAAEEGKAFVRTYSLEVPVKARQNRPEATPIYQFGVFMKEENGVGCTIHDITLVYFSGTKVTFIDSLAQEDFIHFSLGSPYIGANQYRRIAISIPAEKETGVGFWISGIDDNGHEFESKYYLPLEKE